MEQAGYASRLRYLGADDVDDSVVNLTVSMYAAATVTSSATSKVSLSTWPQGACSTWSSTQADGSGPAGFWRPSAMRSSITSGMR